MWTPCVCSQRFVERHSNCRVLTPLTMMAPKLCATMMNGRWLVYSSFTPCYRIWYPVRCLTVALVRGCRGIGSSRESRVFAS